MFSVLKIVFKKPLTQWFILYKYKLYKPSEGNDNDLDTVVCTTTSLFVGLTFLLAWV